MAARRRHLVGHGADRRLGGGVPAARPARGAARAEPRGDADEPAVQRGGHAGRVAAVPQPGPARRTVGGPAGARHAARGRGGRGAAGDGGVRPGGVPRAARGAHAAARPVAAARVRCPGRAGGRRDLRGARGWWWRWPSWSGWSAGCTASAAVRCLAPLLVVGGWSIARGGAGRAGGDVPTSVVGVAAFGVLAGPARTVLLPTGRSGCCSGRPAWSVARRAPSCNHDCRCWCCAGCWACSPSRSPPGTS